MDMTVGLLGRGDRPSHPRLTWSRPTRTRRSSPSPSDGTIVALEEPGRRFVVHDVDGERDPGADRADRPRLEFAAMLADGRLLAVGEGPDADRLCGTSRPAERKPDSTIPTRRSRRDSVQPRQPLPGLRIRQRGDRDPRSSDRRRARRSLTPVDQPDGVPLGRFLSDGRFLARNVSRIPGSHQPTKIWQLDPLAARSPRIPEYRGEPRSRVHVGRPVA